MTGDEACAGVRDDLAELALGILSGRERAAALAHLEQCDRCRAEVDALTLAADGILDAAPSCEPPVGFEQRLVERMRPARRSRRWSPRVALAAVAVIVVAAAAAVVAAVVVSSPGPAPQSATVAPAGARASAVLVGDGQRYGRVSVYAGADHRSGWVFMTVAGADWRGPTRCRVVLAGGRSVTVGQFWLRGGAGSWGGALPVPADRVVGAQIVGPGDRVLASAVLRA